MKITNALRGPESSKNLQGSDALPPQKTPQTKEGAKNAEVQNKSTDQLDAVNVSSPEKKKNSKAMSVAALNKLSAVELNKLKPSELNKLNLSQLKKLSAANQAKLNQAQKMKLGMTSGTADQVDISNEGRIKSQNHRISGSDDSKIDPSPKKKA